ncbi:MAG: ATP synthase subunit I [Burkholderiaceae bacterium]
MNDIAVLLLSGLAGLVLGAFFFGGLWWSLAKGLTSSHPGLWQFTSLMVRMGLTLVGFYAVGGGQWQRLVSCGLGFVIARIVVVRLASVLGAPPSDMSHGGRRASQPR